MFLFQMCVCVWESFRARGAVNGIRCGLEILKFVFSFFGKGEGEGVYEVRCGLNI